MTDDPVAPVPLTGATGIPPTGSGRPPSASTARSLGLVAAIYLWAWVVVSVFLFDAVPRLHGIGLWAGAWIQVGVYVVITAPALISNARLPATDGPARRVWPVASGLVLFAAGVATYVMLYGLQMELLAVRMVKLSAAAAGEEVVFRGAIWALLQRSGLRTLPLIIVNVILFVGLHVPSLLSGHLDGAHPTGIVIVVQFAELAALGTVLCVARLLSRGIALPILLHAANDIAGW